MTDRPFLSTDDLLRQTLGDLSGLRVLDIGAGSGQLTHRLAALGADAVGAEPNPDAVAKAQENYPNIRFVTAPAEALPFDADTFDIAIFSLSLHHASDMDAALQEARRVTKPDGRLLVIDPEMPDPLYPVVRFIVDETTICAQARAALDEVVAAGHLTRTTTLPFAANYRMETPAEMIADLVSIDRGRVLEEEERVEAEKPTSLDPFNFSLFELFAPKAAPLHLTSCGGAASLSQRLNAPSTPELIRASKPEAMSST